MATTPAKSSVLKRGSDEQGRKQTSDSRRDSTIVIMGGTDNHRRGDWRGDEPFYGLKGLLVAFGCSRRQGSTHTHSIEGFVHAHIFLGEAHARNERKTWTVIAICAAMMVAEIVGGVWLGWVAAIADWASYVDSRRCAAHRGAGLHQLAAIRRGCSAFVFGAGKLGTSRRSRALSHLR